MAKGKGKRKPAARAVPKLADQLDPLDCDDKSAVIDTRSAQQAEVPSEELIPSTHLSSTLVRSELGGSQTHKANLVQEAANTLLVHTFPAAGGFPVLQTTGLYNFSGRPKCRLDVDSSCSAFSPSSSTCRHEICLRVTTTGISWNEVRTVMLYAVRLAAEKSERRKVAMRKQRDVELDRVTQTEQAQLAITDRKIAQVVAAMKEDLRNEHEFTETGAQEPNSAVTGVSTVLAEKRTSASAIERYQQELDVCGEIVNQCRLEIDQTQQDGLEGRLSHGLANSKLAKAHAKMVQAARLLRAYVEMGLGGVRATGPRQQVSLLPSPGLCSILETSTAARHGAIVALREFHAASSADRLRTALSSLKSSLKSILTTSGYLTSPGLHEYSDKVAYVLANTKLLQQHIDLQNKNLIAAVPEVTGKDLADLAEPNPPRLLPAPSDIDKMKHQSQETQTSVSLSLTSPLKRLFGSRIQFPGDENLIQSSSRTEDVATPSGIVRQTMTVHPLRSGGRSEVELSNQDQPSGTNLAMKISELEKIVSLGSEALMFDQPAELVEIMVPLGLAAAQAIYSANQANSSPSSRTTRKSRFVQELEKLRQEQDEEITLGQIMEHIGIVSRQGHDGRPFFTGMIENAIGRGLSGRVADPLEDLAQIEAAFSSLGQVSPDFRKLLNEGKRGIKASLAQPAIKKKLHASRFQCIINAAGFNEPSVAALYRLVMETMGLFRELIELVKKNVRRHRVKFEELQVSVAQVVRLARKKRLTINSSHLAKIAEHALVAWSKYQSFLGERPREQEVVDDGPSVDSVAEQKSLPETAVSTEAAADEDTGAKHAFVMSDDESEVEDVSNADTVSAPAVLLEMAEDTIAPSVDDADQQDVQERIAGEQDAAAQAAETVEATAAPWHSFVTSWFRQAFPQGQHLEADPQRADSLDLVFL